MLRYTCMVEVLILTLIYIGLVCAAFYLIIWALTSFGIPLPAQVIKIGWVIVGLICLLLFWRMLGPALSSGHLPR